MGFSIISDKDAEKAYEYVKLLMKLEHTSNIQIDFTRLDGQTEEELRQSIIKVLHHRYNELSALIGGPGEFVVHNT